MGNCIKKESSMEWGGDDWSDDYSPPENKMNQNNYDDYDMSRSLATNDDFTDNLKEPAAKQVKLKITRKQLEQVLKLTKTNTTIQQGVSVEQALLAHFINSNLQSSNQTQTRSWRPDLPTIAEV